MWRFGDLAVVAFRQDTNRKGDGPIILLLQRFAKRIDRVCDAFSEAGRAALARRARGATINRDLVAVIRACFPVYIDAIKHHRLGIRCSAVHKDLRARVDPLAQCTVDTLITPCTVSLSLVPDPCGRRIARSAATASAHFSAAPSAGM